VSANDVYFLATPRDWTLAIVGADRGQPVLSGYNEGPPQGYDWG